jgi:protein-disulfide isomerase
MRAYASDAAGLQGKFWEMHDILFEKQGDYASMTNEQFQEWLIEQANDLGLDQDQFVQDMQSEAVTAKVDQAKSMGWTLESRHAAGAAQWTVLSGSA